MADDGSRVPDSTSRAIASTLFQEAGKAFQRGEYDAAVKRFDAAHALYAILPDTQRDQANCLLGAGIALGSLGEYAAAVERFDAALSLYAILPDTQRDQANCLLSAGLELRHMGEYAAAVKRFDAAHALYATLPDTQQKQANCLLNTGLALGDLGEYAAAVKRYDAAHALYATLPGTDIDQANCLFSAGLALVAVGEYAAAVKRFDAAQTLYATLPGTDINQANCLFSAGIALGDLGEYDAAVERFDAARVQYAAIPGAESDQADCLDAIAIAHFAVGRSTEATDTREQASSLRRTSDRDEIAQAKNTLMPMSILNEPECPASADDLQRALDVLRKERGTEAHQAFYLMQLASAYFRDGLPDESLSLIAQGRAAAIESGVDEIITQSIVLHALLLLEEAHAREDKQEAAGLLEESLALALEAALQMDRARFRLVRPSQRETWIRNRAEGVMNLAIRLAASLDRAELISDLIATWRTVGVLDLQISTSSPKPGDLDTRTLLTSHLPLLPDAAPTLPADAGLPVPGNAPQADAPDDSSALAAAPPVGSQTALSGTDLPRRPGPRLIMPHHRTALDTYSTVPLTTLSPDPEPVRATYR